MAKRRIREKSRLESLDRALGQIDKMFGAGSIMKLDGEQRVIPGISTGTISLDLALGGRGVSSGRIVEIYGPSPPARRRWP